MAEFEEIAELEAAEAADRAAFDPSPAFDRHRRHQASLGRELLRTVDSLRRLQKLDVEPSTDVDSEVTADAEEGKAEACENATNEAKVESTEEPVIEEVKSILCNYEDHDRTQIVPSDQHGLGLAQLFHHGRLRARQATRRDRKPDRRARGDAQDMRSRMSAVGRVEGSLTIRWFVCGSAEITRLARQAS